MRAGCAEEVPRELHVVGQPADQRGVIPGGRREDGARRAALLPPLRGAAAVGEGLAAAATVGRGAAFGTQPLVHDPAESPRHKGGLVRWQAVPGTLAGEGLGHAGDQGVHTLHLVAVFRMLVEKA